MTTIAVKVFQNFKCGAVYCNGPSVYIISCTFCDSRVHFEEFINHFRQKHLTQLQPTNNSAIPINLRPDIIASTPIHKPDGTIKSDFVRGDDTDEDTKPEEHMLAEWDNLNYVIRQPHEMQVANVETVDSLEMYDDDLIESEIIEEASEIVDVSDAEKELQSEIEEEEVSETVDDSDAEKELQSEIEEEEANEEDGVCLESEDVEHEEATDEGELQRLHQEEEDDKYEERDENADYNFSDADINESDSVIDKFFAQLPTNDKLIHRKNRKKEERPYTCKVCFGKTKTELGLIYHIRQKHRGEQDVYAETVGDGQFSCEFCERVFRTRVGLVGHISILHNPASKKIRPFTSEEKIEREPKKKQKHICEQCGKTFSISNMLRNHVIKVHTDMTCKLCGKVFKEPWPLIDHWRIHSNEKAFQCDECGEKFRTNRQRLSHARKHRIPDPKICDICGLECRDKANLTRHMKRHEEIPSFKCRECGKQFYHKYERNAHEQKHLRSVNNAQHTCEICGRKYLNQRTLKVHKLRHLPKEFHVACTVCEKRFRTKTGLKMHMRNHTKMGTFDDMDDDDDVANEEEVRVDETQQATASIASGIGSSLYLAQYEKVVKTILKS